MAAFPEQLPRCPALAIGRKLCYRPVMSGTGATVRILAALAIAVLSESMVSGAAPEPGLIEGFEDLTNVKPSGGEIAPVRGGQGVTQGQQAAELPPGTAVSIAADLKKFESAGWLKIDTLGAGRVPCSLGISVSGPMVRHNTVAHVRQGKDTIAMPWLTRMQAIQMPGRAPENEPEQVIVRLKNLSDSALTIDNVRVEGAAAPPTGALLLDFGPGGQPVWPGFQGATAGGVNIIWSGKRSIQSYSTGYPDPLTGDFVGPSLSNKQSDFFEIERRDGSPAVAWLWVTHYADGYTQPAEYAVRVNGRVLLRKRIGYSGLLGTDGVLEGRGGDWTPKWFDETYARHFAEMIKFELPGGKAHVDVLDCQLAAMIIAPANQQAAVQAYINGLNTELSLYRQQFVVGERKAPVCEFAPTDEETKSNVIVFQSPAGADFFPLLSPGESTRVRKVHIQAAAGSRAMAAVAVAPIKETLYLSATLGDLRDENRRLLAGRSEVFVVEPVPRVIDGRVEFHPWILTRRAGRLSARELAFLLVSVHPREKSIPGTYEGNLHLNMPGAPTDVPVSVEVTDAGSPGRAQEPVMGAVTGTDVAGLQRAYAMSQAPSQASGATTRVRQMLMSDGLNALFLSGPTFNNDLAVVTDQFLAQIRSYPAAQAAGPTLLDVRPAISMLESRSARPGTRDYRSSVSSLVSKTISAAKRSLPGGIYFYLGYLSDGWSASREQRMAAEIREVGGKAAAVVSTTTISRGTGTPRNDAFDPFAALMFRIDSRGLSESIAAFKRLGKERKAFLVLPQPDRYSMGFFARSVGADGCYLETVFMDRGGPYSGFWVNGKGLIVPQPGGDFAPTLAMLNVRLGRDDYLLMARAEEMLRLASAAKQPAAELEEVLEKIKSAARSKSGFQYDTYLMRTTAVKPEELESWRNSLIKACGKVAAALEEKDKKSSIR